MKKNSPPLQRAHKIYKNLINKPHVFFLVVSLLFGFIFILLTPPLQGPDEQAHFLQAYKLSEGNFVNDPTDTYPVSLRKTYKTIMYDDDIRFAYKNKYEFWRTKNALKIPLNQNTREVGDGYMSGTSYSPVVYVGQAIMIFIGRLCSFAPVVLIYLARIGNLAVWALLVYWAIKISHIGKWQMAVLGIIPMVVFQGSVITSDSFGLGVLLLYIAYILRLFVQSKHPTAKQYFLLGVLAAMLALSKIVMLVFIPIIFLLLLDNKSKFKNRASMIKLCVYLGVIVVSSTLLAFIWSAISGNLNVNNLPDGVHPDLQIHSLLVHPGEFLFALWNTNFYEWSDGIVRSTIGTFGWVDTPISLSLVILGYISLFVVMVANRGKEFVAVRALTSIKSRLFLYVIGFAYFMGVSFALYAYYSPVDFNIIVGLQGRYFIPLFVLPIILFINTDQAVLKEKLYNIVVKFMPVFILSMSVVYIIMRYYFHSGL